MSTTEICVTPMATQADAEAFRRLNETWIRELFAIEAQDLATLEDPFGAIVDRGGTVLVARDGDRVVGVVSLVPEGHGVYELSKMAVDTAERGRGIGRLLMEAAIAWACDRGGRSLFLGSNRKLAPAVGLYESVGFVHVAPDAVGPLPYTRADVFMSLAL